MFIMRVSTNVEAKYHVAATSNGVNTILNQIPSTTCALNIISPTPIVDTINDSLIKVTNSLPKAVKYF